MAKRKAKKEYTHIPWLDNLLTLIFVALAVLTCYVLPVGDLIHLGGYTVATVVAITSSKAAFLWLAPKIGTQAAIEKPRNVRKFADQGWQMVIHASMSALELYILYEDDWKMWNEPDKGLLDYCARSPAASCISTRSWSGKTYTVLPSIRALYLAQLAIWAFTAISHRFLEARHKDYFVMYLHHIITLILVLGSYVLDLHKIGVVVLFVHDFSDIVTDSLKMTNYMDLDSKSGTFLVEVTFATNLFTWFLFRLYYFPVKVISVLFSPNSRNWSGEVVEQSNLGLLLDTSCVACNVLRIGLIILNVMHIYWFALFIRILIKLIKGSNPHDVGKDEYEGASSDSEADEAKKK